MPLVHECSALRCGVLTMGTLCLDHEATAKIKASVAGRLTAFTRAVELGEQPALLSLQPSL